MIWKLAGINPKGNWYFTTHDFMMATLKKADELKGYFMVDSSTWIVAKGQIHNLSLLYKGDPILFNVYHALCSSDSLKENPFVGKFLNILTSIKAQKIIENYGKNIYGKPLYHTAEYMRNHIN